MRNATRGAVLGDAVAVADSSATRSVGLLQHTGLNAGEGLWIVPPPVIPCQSVHTFFMKFAIDLVYLDKRRRVRKVRHAVPPWRISGCFWAFSVLELPAGSVAPTGTQPGDQLEIE
ncbi:MAG: DUF192 domain-containing protein [Bryobacteraceae bacterium]